jgi:myo-inositol catabolism protein IolC
MIFDAFKAACNQGAPREFAGILVDEEFGTAVAREAKSNDYTLAMPVEKSGQAEFQFEYGEDFGSHIEAFDPKFSKVLVRYNPEGDSEMNQRQIGNLARLSQWLHERDRKLLFELLVPATSAQLKYCGSQDHYDRELRASLVVKTFQELQEGGVEPDIWKIEGLDERSDCERAVRQAQTGSGREDVRCVVLGRGASVERDIQWLSVAAGVPGFAGFAIGRTLWQEALKGYVAGKLSREETRKEIAGRYLEMISAFENGRRDMKAA